MRGFFVARIRWRKKLHPSGQCYFISSICRARLTERLSWR